MSTSSTTDQDPAPFLDDQDESVRIAVKALGDMRNSRPQPSGSTPARVYNLLPLPRPRLHDCLPRSQESWSSPLNLEASSSTLPPDSADDANSVDFVARVSTIPLVNTALRAYEQTKASSKVVKVRFYSAPLSTTFILCFTPARYAFDLTFTFSMVPK